MCIFATCPVVKQTDRGLWIEEKLLSFFVVKIVRKKREFVGEDEPQTH